MQSHEFLRDFVKSGDGKTDYFVDLMSNGGNGRCDCHDFTCHRWPLLRANERKRWKTRCKHIRLFRMRLAAMLRKEGHRVTLDEIIKAVLKKEGDGEGT